MSSVVWNGKWSNTLLDYMMDAGRGVLTVGAGLCSAGGGVVYGNGMTYLNLIYESTHTNMCICTHRVN